MSDRGGAARRWFRLSAEAARTLPARARLPARRPSQRSDAALHIVGNHPKRARSRMLLPTEVFSCCRGPSAGWPVAVATFRAWPPRFSCSRCG